jgi:hypothetical protein
MEGMVLDTFSVPDGGGRSVDETAVAIHQVSHALSHCQARAGHLVYQYINNQQNLSRVNNTEARGRLILLMETVLFS